MSTPPLCPNCGDRMSHAVVAINAVDHPGFLCGDCGRAETVHPHVMNLATIRLADGTNDILEAECRVCGRFGSIVAPSAEQFNFDD